MSHYLIIVSAIYFCLILSVASGDEPTTDYDKLQGTWKIVYSETNGKGVKPINDVRRSFKKKLSLVIMAGKVAGKFSFRIDSSKKPKWITFTTEENKLIPESKGSKIYCIYKLKGNRLTIRFPATFPWSQRPNHFPTKRGDAAPLVVYVKVRD